MKLPQQLITLGTVLIIIFLALLSIKTFVDIRHASDDVENQRTISVYGQAEVTAVPDTTEFSFTVLGQGATSETALTEATEKSDAALEALQKAGVEERDIQTASLTTNPRYAYQEGTAPRITGYESSQTITVKVREQDQAGELIAAVTEAGADRVSGVTLSIDDDEEYIREARKQAIEDAREEAELLAEDLGVSLGEVVSFVESSRGQGSMPYYDRVEMAQDDAGGASAPQIPVGENTFESNVEVTFRIY